MIHFTDYQYGEGDLPHYAANNILYNDGETEFTPNAVGIFDTPTLIEDAQLIDYNLYYATPDSNQYITKLYSSTTGTTIYWKVDEFEDWINSTIYDKPITDSHSPTPADPLFVDPENDDFSLQAGSPAIGAGIPILESDGFAITIDTDYYGNTRDPENPTIGAIEYFSSSADPLAGDLDGDDNISLSDTIIGLQVISGNSPSESDTMTDGDVDGDGKVGMAEVIYTLQELAK
jgi:hypothetical protein